MTHFLDSLPFDWTKPAAQELREFLAGIYYRVDQVIPILQQSGIPPAAIALDRPMYQVWHSLIENARNRDRLRPLLDQVSQSADGAVAARLRELTGENPIVSADHAAQGDAAGLGGKWQGFDDRKALERLIFDEDDTLLDVAFLQRGLEVSSAITRLLVTFHAGQYYGTGFRIADDLLLTNHHVLFDWESRGEPARAVEAWFGYERDFGGRQLAHATVTCNVNTIAGNRELDWAVVRTTGPLPDGCPILGMRPQDGPPRVDDRLYIIQHPEGGPKKIGMHHNIVRFTDSRVVQYWTDTKRGSSGSPVFNERWEVVALHHRWVQSRHDGKREYRNQGVRIEPVHDGIVAGGLL